MTEGSPAPYGVRLRVAYDGTDFAGWQRQPGQRTVQGTLEEAVRAMTGAAAVVRGASRTDAGVHAEDQVAAFDTALAVPPKGWALGLNRELPPDVAVVSAEPCPAGAEPRFEAAWKRYRYVLQTGDVRDPLWRRRAWFLGAHQLPGGAADALAPREAARRLDLAAMRDAAAALVGTHDFRAFAAADDTRENRVRTLHRVAVIEGWFGAPHLVAIEVEGTAFLKNMVRILAGTLVEVGRRRFDRARVEAALGPGASRTDAGPTAPPEGLTLTAVGLADAGARPGARSR